ncbi:MAG: hypothetical protein ABIV50_06515 [Opitutus sp.]
MKTHGDAPWEKAKPEKQQQRTKLSKASVAWAKARAQKAGRRYPNLVDNMAAARRQKENGSAKGANHSHP